MNGCFINLQRSGDRRAAMEAQLRALGIEGVARFEAIDAATLPAAAPDATTSAGERACFLSHARALEGAPPDDFFLVLEDDALLSRALPPLLRPEALAQLADWDLVFLECLPYTSAPVLLALWQALKKQLPADPTVPRDAIAGIEVLDARGLYNWGAVAYLATPKGLRALPPLLREALAEGPAQAFDMALNRWVAEGRLRAAVLAPFLATPRLESHAHSTIDDRPRAAENDALGGALRRLFFAGPIDGLESHVAGYRHAALTDDPKLRLLADLMAQLFVITARDA
ncbi:glycosyltransferase family 25 protein [Variovorax paradoxus]|uniref:glycosyltransferase family 25 protein n=1 Tax=Variovorax paradoxus TaxID=34073 RepID=UPI0019330AE2|nr:glycosyltransferase family 25 protein [Variovorax paradoxus]